MKDKDGALAIAKKINKLDPLSVVSDAFNKIQAVSTVRGGSETFCRFESRSDAAVWKHHAVCKDAKSATALLAFLLLLKAQLDFFQRVSKLTLASVNPGNANTNSTHSKR